MKIYLTVRWESHGFSCHSSEPPKEARKPQLYPAVFTFPSRGKWWLPGNFLMAQLCAACSIRIIGNSVEPWAVKYFSHLLPFAPFVLLFCWLVVLLPLCPVVLLYCCPVVMLSCCLVVLLSFCPFVLLSFCPLVHTVYTVFLAKSWEPVVRE